MLDDTGTAVIVFNCNLANRGSITFEIATGTLAFADQVNAEVPVDVDDTRYEIVAMMLDSDGKQMAMTWGSQSAVNDAANAIFESAGPVTVALGEHVYNFVGADRSENFARMLDTCGGRY
ncbi:hypothetical protein [Devosia sp. SL43]|uniref:hypothetical protein n=1 Tax=Devosia sp. SL43 TaxID=2806348 RepID=UPI001F3385DC|nr:hypothetical protein [Devosia sp. SL43]UJW86089.1 hypothetical protein IM737_02045 [Devosia sp. SL43]